MTAGPSDSRGRALLLAVLQSQTGTAVARRCGVRKTAVSALATGRNREPRLYLAVKLQELYGIPVQAWIQENARPVSKSTRVDSRGPTLIKEAVTEIADNRLNRAAE